MNAKKTRIWAGITLAMFAGYASGEESVVATPDSWVCKYCPIESGFGGSVAPGIGFVSEDGYKFGGYLGLEDGGVYPMLDMDLRYRGEEAGYFKAQTSALGMPFGAAEIEGGRQGRYELEFEYQQIPRRFTDGAQTPYNGVDSDRLTLPQTWVEGATTGAMTALGSTLADVDIDQDRILYALKLRLNQSSRWQPFAYFKRDEVEGLRTTGGNFFTSSVTLPEPVDYTTDRAEVGLGYQGESFQGKISYHGSFFSNDNRSLTWENPFTPVGGAEFGQMALPPDNTFQQVVLSGAYHLSVRTHLLGSVARGRGAQDEDFLPYTINSTVATSALPRESLDGRIDTTTASARLVSLPWEPLRLTLDYRFNKRDNATPQATYNYVVTDTATGTPRTNLPYSFQEETGRVRADYRMTSASSLSLAYERREQERTFQQVEQTDEDTGWAELKVHTGVGTAARLRVGRTEREGSALEQVAAITPPQNPLLEKYNLANRERDFGELRVDHAFSSVTSIGISASYAADDYTESVIGLTSGDEMSATIDLSWSPKANLSYYAFYTWQHLESEQTNSEGFSLPDWSATHDDRIDLAGVGVTTALSDAVKVGADYYYSRSRSEITINPGGSFPDLETRLRAVRLRADYRASERIGLRLGLLYEHYKSEDWMLDGVEAATIPTVLTLGEESPDYDAFLLTVAVRYELE